MTDVISVGAIDAADSGNDDIESFSSQGPSTIITNFTSQTSTQRQSLDGASIDGVQTKVGSLGYFSNPFYGTSAAAPHAAAVAALILDANGFLTAAGVSSILATTAVDIGTSGYDNVSGYGRFDALGAVYKAFTPGAPDLDSGSDSGVSSTDNLTKDTTPTFTGTVPLGSYVRIYVDGVEKGAEQLASNDGTYSITTSTLTEGSHAVTVRVAENSSVPTANLSNASSALTIQIDTTAPTFVSYLPYTAYVTTPMFDFDVTFSEPVTSVDASDVHLQGYGGAPIGTVSSPSQVDDPGAVWRFPMSIDPGPPEGFHGFIFIAEDSNDILDRAGNGNPSQMAFFYYIFDFVSPEVTAKTPENTAIAATSTNIDVTFSEQVYGVDITDLLLTGPGAATASKDTPVDISGGQHRIWRFPVSGLADGAVNVSLAPDSGDITDYLGHDLANVTWTFSVDVTAPQVVGVIVSGSSSTHDPYSVPVGSGANQLETVPVGGANRLTLIFDEQVTIQQSDLVLKGRDKQSNETTYSFSGFSTAAGPGQGQYQATWTISGEFGARQVSAKLLSSASNVRDLVGNQLDGEWDNPSNLADGSSDTFPSGNGSAGGNFSFSFTSLPGDAGGSSGPDNIVDGADYSIWADNFLASPRVFTQGDWSGNALVDGGDYTLWSDNFLTDFTGSPYVLAVLPGMAFAYGPEGAKSYIEWLYTTGGRDWRLDARRFLGAIDEEFALASDAVLEGEFLKFDWIDQIGSVTADSPARSAAVAGSGEEVLANKLDRIDQAITSDNVSAATRDRLTRELVFWRHYLEESNSQTQVRPSLRHWIDHWYEVTFAKLH